MPAMKKVLKEAVIDAAVEGRLRSWCWRLIMACRLFRCGSGEERKNVRGQTWQGY